MALRVANGRPLRLCYADPPYPGNADLYAGHVDFAGEVDHAALVEQLCDEFPDGWALSTSAAALRDVLALCPSTVRVAAWVRGERPTPSYAPLSSWEPVIINGGRAYLSAVDARRLDALVYAAKPRTTDPRRVIGAKPAAFCWWLFDLLGALPGDELVDLFPGSGGVARAWSLFSVADLGATRVGDELDASAVLEPATTRRVSIDDGSDAGEDAEHPARRQAHVAADVGRPHEVLVGLVDQLVS